MNLNNKVISSNLFLIIKLNDMEHAVSDTAFACFDLKPEYMSSTTGSVANGTF